MVCNIVMEHERPNHFTFLVASEFSILEIESALTERLLQRRVNIFSTTVSCILLALLCSPSLQSDQIMHFLSCGAHNV